MVLWEGPWQEHNVRQDNSGPRCGPDQVSAKGSNGGRNGRRCPGSMGPWTSTEQTGQNPLPFLPNQRERGGLNKKALSENSQVHFPPFSSGHLLGILTPNTFISLHSLEAPERETLSPSPAHLQCKQGTWYIVGAWEMVCWALPG